jgi:hypothetical protein
VAPLAEDLGLAVGREPALSEEVYEKDPAGGLDRVLAAAAAGGVTVLTSQGGVIPDLLGTLSALHDVTLGRRAGHKVPARKSSVWALSFLDSRLLAADYHPDRAEAPAPPAPGRARPPGPAAAGIPGDVFANCYAVAFAAVLRGAALVVAFLAGVALAVVDFVALAAVVLAAVAFAVFALAGAAFAVDLAALAGVAFAALALAGAAFAVDLAALAGVAFAALALAGAAFAVVFVAAPLAAAFAGATFGSFLDPLTTFRNSWPARNAGTEVFLTFTFSPVAGLRAVRAARSRFSNTPKPVRATFSPF